MDRKASVIWEGGLRDGSGTINTDSGALSNAQYSLGTRFENLHGTNPEELIAAAHAACFSMALSAQLELLGLRPSTIKTSATVALTKSESNWTITGVTLDTVAHVPGADRERFDKATNQAKTGCPISRLLNTAITLNARLMSEPAVEKLAG